MNLEFLPEVVFIPERRILTFPFVRDGVRVWCGVGNGVLALLTGCKVETEEDQVTAFDRCRPRLEAILRQMLEAGRSWRRGMWICPEDVLLTTAQTAR